MKKTKLFDVFALLFGAGMLLGLLTGCKDSLIKENADINNTDGKTAYIKVREIEASRAVLPTFTLDTIADFSFVLRGGKVGGTEDTFGTYSNLSKLQNASIAVETGIYNFTLIAEKAGTVLQGTIESLEIEAGDNPLYFTLQWNDDVLNPENLGSFNYTLDFSTASNASDVKYITGELKAYDSENHTDSSLSDDRYAETPLTPSDGTITYSLENVPAGLYHIYIHFYADEAHLAPMISPYPAFTTITGGVESTSSDEIANPFNTVYSITLNNLNDVSADNLPTKYTIDSPDITLPVLEKAGWHFGGWYAEEDFSGSEITEIPSGSTGDKVFYAKWSVATISVSIEPIADLSLTALPNEEDNTVTFTVTGGKEGSTYDWYVDGLAAEASGDTFVLEPNAIGTKTYVVEVISGTRSATATAQITATKIRGQSQIVLFDFDVSTIGTNPPSSGIEFASPTPGFYAVSNFESVKSLDSSSLQNAKIKEITAIPNSNADFAIDPANQAIYTLTGTSNQGTNNTSIYKHIKYPGSDSVTTTLFYDGINYTVQDMCAYDGNVYLLKNGGGTNNAIIRISEDGTAVTLAYSDTSGKILNHSVNYKSSHIEVYKDNLYFVSIEDITGDYDYTILVSQISINENTLGTPKVIYSTGFVNSGLEIAKLNISDFQAIDGNDGSVNLYILCNAKNVSQQYDGSSYLRGGIITVKVDDNNLKFTNFDGTDLSDRTKPNIFGWYENMLGNAIAENDYTKSYFYGPSRFVARKPDELVIVDECYYYGDENSLNGSSTSSKVNKNNVVSVNLKTFAITDSTSVDLGFETYLSSDLDGGSNVYYVKSYRNGEYNY